MASISSMTALVAFTLLACATPSNGNAFLSKVEKGDALSLSKTSVEEKFLREVRGLTGKGNADLAIPAIRSALEPMWLALPKNQHGGLDNEQVRYALHRLFVQRHGWYIDGLSGVTNETSPVGMLRERVPMFIMELFEEAFGQTGLKLHELVVFAATLESLIHDEATQRLRDVYGALQLNTEESQDSTQAETTMKAFMMSLILRKDLTKAGALEKGFRFLDRNYPSWSEMQTWMTNVRQTTLPGMDVHSFDDMSNATEQMSMQLGGYLDSDCRKMKDALLEDEEADSGRVLLSNFYKKGMEKNFHFVEKASYLRQLGALDESHPGEPQVIIPNFIVSPNNCLVDNGFYSICCLNECESVLKQLEGTVGAPSATPEKIVSTIASISTSSVAAPRTLPQTMVARLELVAERNGGMVPLYGRLFNQWLHFAFPRECPYPHTTGSTNPISPDEYLKENAEKSILNVEQMNKYIASAKEGLVSDPEKDQETGASKEESIDLRWSDEEEHFFLPSDTPRSMASTVFRGVLVVLLLSAIAIAGADAMKRFSGKDGILGNMEKQYGYGQEKCGKLV